MDKYKKEMNDLPAELRALRIKKDELNSEVYKAEKKKMAVDSELIELRNAIRKERERRNTLSEENLKTDAEITNKRNALKKDQASLMHSIDNLNIKSEEISQDEEKVLKGNIDLDRRNTLLTQAKAEHEKKVLAFKKEQLDWAESKKTDAELTGEVNRQLEENKKKGAALDKKLDEASSKVDRASALQEILSKQIADVEAAKKELSDSKKSLDAIKRTYEIEITNTKTETEEVKDEKQKVIAQQKSLSAQFDALESKEKELKIRELRFRKLVREKDLEKELKQLEESMK